MKNLPDRKRNTLQGEIREHVEPGSPIITDDFVSCFGLESDYVHEFVTHAEAYVRGNVHTNPAWRTSGVF